MVKYSDIEKYIREDNFLGKGEEVSVYRLKDKVIKIFYLKMHYQTFFFSFVASNFLIFLNDHMPSLELNQY